MHCRRAPRRAQSPGASRVRTDPRPDSRRDDYGFRQHSGTLSSLGWSDVGTTSDQKWREVYESQIDLIDRVVRSVCRRNGLSADEAEEFRSEVHLKLIETDHAVFRAFDGRSSLKTYLTVVVQRMMLDFRTSRWGKWRPSEAARRLGPDAVRLETVMIRDGMAFSEAVELLRTNHGCRSSRDELYAMTLAFPVRTGRASQREVAIERVDAPAVQPDDAPELHESVRQLSTALRNELDRMESEERLILEMLYIQGHKISVIARVLSLDQKTLYRTVTKLQDRLRSSLERKGVTWGAVEPLLDGSSTSLDLEELFRACPSTLHETGARSAPGGQSQ